MDPLVTSEAHRTLVTTCPPLLQPQIKMKKCCSCEPGGPLCFLDPLVTYDWNKRPKRENCDLTEPETKLEWKVSHISQHSRLGARTDQAHRYKMSSLLFETLNIQDETRVKILCSIIHL